MSQIAAIKSAIGEEGIRTAVEALKEIAADEKDYFKSEHRVEAARTLLSYATYPSPEGDD